MATVEFASKLKKARQSAGLTQKNVYEILEVPQSTFSSWEVGKSEPDAMTLIKLCNLYKIKDFSYFIDENASPPTSPSQEEPSDRAPAPDETQLLADYRSLNDEGKEKARGLMDDLVQSRKYKVSNTKENTRTIYAAASDGVSIQQEVPEADVERVNKRTAEDAERDLGLL